MGESVIVSVSGLSAHSLGCAYEAHRVHIIDTLVLRMSPRTDTKARMRKIEMRNGMKNETGNMACLLLYLIAERMESHWHERLRR